MPVSHDDIPADIWWRSQSLPVPSLISTCSKYSSSSPSVSLSTPWPERRSRGSRSRLSTQHTILGFRRPKLFFISTSSTTSTLSTLSVCYTTNAALSACGRKKRALDSIMSSGDAVEEELRRMAPSQTQRSVQHQKTFSEHLLSSSRIR